MRYKRRVRVLRLLATLIGFLALDSLVPVSVGASHCTSPCWIQKQTLNSPSPRYAAAMVENVLFGGTTASGDVGDTWHFDSIDWTRVATGGPSARHGAAMERYFNVPAPQSLHYLLFGGSSGGTYLGDTWYLTPNNNNWNWTRQDVSPSPSPREGATIQVYDVLGGPTGGLVIAQHAVLFGGRNGSGPLNDTWVWDGSGWTLKSPPVSPPARSDAWMGSSKFMSGTVLHGGSSATGTLGDTWTWDGSTWSKVTAGGGPSARFGAARKSSRGTLIGGNSGTKALSDQWSWTGTNWERFRATGAPSARYLAGGGDSTLFGGRNGAGALLGDTWVLDRPSPGA